jgi:hypothetical protein
VSSAGVAPRNYENASPQLELGGDVVVTNKGVGDEEDFYPTPAWVTRAILPHLPPFWQVLDPCAGDGAMLDAIGEVPVSNRNGARFDHICSVTLRGFELHEGRAHAAGHLVDCRDALSADGWGFFDLAILNPPFSLAEDFVRRALGEAAPQRATVAALLRLAFLEGGGRVPLHREHPSDVFVFANRPSFIDPQAFRPCPRCKGGKVPRPDEVRCVRCLGKTQIKGGSDSSAYGWFVFGPGRGGRWSVLDDRDPNKKAKPRKGRVS